MGRPLLLIEAAHSYRRGSEDRLTEILASTLDVHPGFCRALTDELGLPSGERHVVTTQHRTDPECRVDMRVEVRGQHDEVSSVLYSEHKIDGYWFSEGQVQREQRGLDREPASRRLLICVVPEAALAELKATPPDSPVGVVSAKDFDRALDWKQIADLAQAAGEQWPVPWGGTDWTDRALAPDAPAAQRVLAEFLAYVEGEEVLGPLSIDDIHAFQLADQAQEKIDQVLALAAEKVTSFPALKGKNDELVYDDLSATGVPLTCVDFKAPHGHWLHALSESTLAVAVATTDADMPSGGGEPMIYAGIYISTDRSPAAEADAAWMADAASQELKALSYERGLWLCRSRPLSTLLPADKLEAQAVALSRWLMDAFQAAVDMREPASATPDAPRRRRTRR